MLAWTNLPPDCKLLDHCELSHVPTHSGSVEKSEEEQKAILRRLDGWAAEERARLTGIE
jgi:hypothetical protein